MPFFIRKTITVVPSLCDPQPFALHLYVTQFLTTDFQSEILRKILNHFKMLILKSDFNAVLFVIKSRELLCKNIKITTVCILKKGFTHKNYLDNNYFRLLLSGFIRMKVETTFSLGGCLDVT